MNDITSTFAETPADSVPPLAAGEHLDQKTFHTRYAAMPENVWAELIEGVVYILPRVKASHGQLSAELICWLGVYHAATSGTDALCHATTILGKYSEVQPDACLLVLPECGGQTRDDEEDFLTGPPELVAEVAMTDADCDLHAKRRDYERAGVREYIILVIQEKRVVWFVRRGDGFAPLEPGADGVFHSEFFGGLLLDAAAILQEDTLRVHEVLQQGLASPEHKAFVDKLRRP
jgi:Uma2 family endonuclease